MKSHRKTILVIAPHPDDEVLGCGGTILRHIEEGNKVVVCVTSVRNVPLFTEEMNKAQYDEIKKAHAFMGISETIVLPFDSVMLDQINQYKLNESILKVVERIEPDEVYLPFSGDVHLDHQIVAKSAMVACRPIGEKKIPKIFMYETLSETEWNVPTVDNLFVPNVYIDISKYIDKKVMAMTKYSNQLKINPHPRSGEKIKALSSYRGSLVSMEYAESFMLVREIVS